MGFAWEHHFEASSAAYIFIFTNIQKKKFFLPVAQKKINTYKKIYNNNN